jgi:hypothetical protein
MPREPRIIFKNSLYEIVPRAREGLPLPPTDTTNQLLKGILARTQRDDKVTVCNFVEMNNHSHQHAISNEPDQLSKFYMEYQKKITDSVRKLTRAESLQLWEGRPSVALLALAEDAIVRLIYMFLNPAKAGLVQSIDDYPGLTTWEAFKTCEASVDAQVTVEAYWTPASQLEPLPEHNKLSPASDRAMARSCRENPKTIKYEMVIKPLAWLACYGITDPVRIEKIRQRIIKAVYDGEAQLAKERLEKKIPVMGAERLKQQAYLKPHTPKAKERRIFLICGDNKRRPKLIALFKDIAKKCRECYLLLKEGKPHDWPPGTFIPWVPPKICQAVCF